MLISLAGAAAGLGVVWYTAEFYALFYMQTVLRINPRTTNVVVAIALLIGMPLFAMFGALSDRIGRKKIMMTGALLAVTCYSPIYKAMQSAAGNNVVTVQSTRSAATGAISLTPLSREASGLLGPAPEASRPDVPLLVFLVFVQVIFATMLGGPMAAYLVEACPAKIRYTSVSLTHNLGSGIFGGLLPLIRLTLCAATGNIYAGLWYPMIVAGITFVAVSLLLKETRQVRIWDEVRNRDGGTTLTECSAETATGPARNLSMRTPGTGERTHETEIEGSAPRR